MRLHPLSPFLDAGRMALFGGVIALRAWSEGIEAGSSFASGLGLILLLAAGVFLGGVVALAYALVAQRFRLYRMTSALVEQKTGVLFRTHRQLPYDRIESVDTAQPLIPRALGLAEVRVHAISAADQDLRLRYLALADAVALRERLSARRTSTPDDGSLEAATPLLQVPPRELMLGYAAIPVGRILVLLVWVAMIVAVVAGPAEALAMFLFGGLVGVLPASFNAARQVERLWGFSLTDGPAALVIQRGLLNLATQRIHPDRVQAIRIDQPLMWRPLDRFRLVVDIAGHRGAEENQAARAGDLLPIAPYAIVRGLLARLEVRADLEALDYVTPPGRARWRSLRSSSFRVASTPSHLVVRSGVLWRRTTIVPHARVQSARVTQGPWQRALGLASLHLDTAGPRVRVVAHHRGCADAIAQARESTLTAAGGVTPGR